MAGITAAHRMSHPGTGRLVLMRCSPSAIAAAPCDLGQDVIAAAERAELRAMSDDEVNTWAPAGILYISSRAFPPQERIPAPDPDSPRLYGQRTT